MTPEKRLARFERAIPPYWRIVNRGQALDALSEVDGKIIIVINHSERGQLIGGFPSSLVDDYSKVIRKRPKKGSK